MSVEVLVRGQKLSNIKFVGRVFDVKYLYVVKIVE